MINVNNNNNKYNRGIDFSEEDDLDGLLRNGKNTKVLFLFYFILFIYITIYNIINCCNNNYHD